MVPLMILLASCDSDGSTNGVTWPKKTCCTFFDHLYVMDAMVPFMMLLASFDGDTNIMWCWCQHQWCHMTKNVNLHLIWCKGSIECLLVTHEADVDTNGMTWPKKSCCTSFQQPFYLRNSVVSLTMLLVSCDGNASILWHWGWYQWHHMTKNVIAYLISIILT